MTSAFVATVAACGGGDGEDGLGDGPLFQPKPECEGESVVAFAGKHQMVMSSLEIGAKEDGFDLDGDGEPDNKLSAISNLARTALEDSFDDRAIVLPFEFFDLPDTVAEDECVKFAVYAGTYQVDLDEDGRQVAREVRVDRVNTRADCNDHDPNISPDMPEIPDNGKDDNCNGLADEIMPQSEAEEPIPSDDTQDLDQDGVTIADGDCDDTNPMVNPNMPEICGDGFDNNCDRSADWAFDELALGKSTCTPYDTDLEELFVEEFSFNSDGSPQIIFNSGIIRNVDGRLALEAGPSRFSVTVPLDDSDTLNLQLRISGAQIHGDFVQREGGWGLENGRLGGILSAVNMDEVTGLEVDEIGLAIDDTLLDAAFGNILGILLALPRKGGEGEYADCQVPDIDVDRDGLEAFCDSNPLDEVNRVDVCVDGDGTVVFDEIDANGDVTVQCTQAVNDAGEHRFPDGISVEMNFTTVPARLPTNRL